jgi:hypothetical protein
MKTKHFNLLRRLEAALSIERLDMVLPEEELEGCVDLKEAFPDTNPCAWMFFGNMGAWPRVAVDEKGNIIKVCDNSPTSRWAVEGPVYREILGRICKLIRDAVRNGHLQIDPEFNEVKGRYIKQNFDWSTPVLGPYTDNGYVFSEIFPRWQEERDDNAFQCFDKGLGNMKDILEKLKRYYQRAGGIGEEGILGGGGRGWKSFATDFVHTLIDCVLDIIREGIPA